MTVSPWILALEYSDSADFSSSTTVSVPVLVAYPKRVSTEEPTVHLGGRQKNTSGWYRQITVTTDFSTYAASSYDYGDILALETALFAPYLRITDDTNLERTDGSSEFWAALTATGYEVVRKSYDSSASPENGAQQATFTLEAAHRNT